MENVNEQGQKIIETGVTENGNSESKTYSQEEINALLQKEGDRRVSQALQTAKEKWEKEWTEKLEQEKSEAAKLAKMTAAEKEKALLEKAKLEFENERAEFERQKQELIKQKEIEELKSVAISALNDLGHTANALDFVFADDADTINENIKKLDEYVKEIVDAKIKQRVSKTITPSKVNNNLDFNSITKEQFKSMGLIQRTELKLNNPELFAKLNRVYKK